MAEQNTATLRWQHGLHFEVVSGSGHTLATDSISRPEHRAPSPMELFLAGVAGCTAMDVVAILAKMREEVTAMEVSATGERAPNHPKHFTAIEITYRIVGRDVSEEKVRRAVELSHGTYCSAAASLRPDCRVTSRVEIREASSSTGT
jgi:putative redox protein